MGLDLLKIRKLREEMGLSQADAATRAGLANRQAWWNIESGERPNVTLDTLEKIAAALGVKAKDLLK